MKNSGNRELVVGVSSKGTAKSYELNGTYSEDVILGIAETILSERIYSEGEISSPADIKRYLTLHFRDFKQEVFAAVFLTNRHGILAIENLFFGTIDGASVYPREVVRKVIEHNAAAVILSHNHPSGVVEPSEADKRITERLVQALTLIDVRVLDHVIVSGGETVSFAELGLM